MLCKISLPNVCFGDFQKNAIANVLFNDNISAIHILLTKS
jgi:hypothetical protein